VAVELSWSELVLLGHSASVELLGLEHDVSVKVATVRNTVVMMGVVTTTTMMMMMMVVVVRIVRQA